MVLKDCIFTKESHQYWSQLIAERFSILQESSNIKYLSLKEYLTETPQKFYNQKSYEDYYSFLVSLSKNMPNLMFEFFNTEAHKLNIAFETLNEINKLLIHDKVINISKELEVIRFIENDIHYNYLQLVECTFYPFILLIAKYQRKQRQKSIDGLDVYNCVEELHSTSFEYLKDCYNNTIRNGIAHGDFIYTATGITYKDKKGEPYTTYREEVVILFDNIVDCCNAMALAIKCFMITNHDYCRNHGLKSPKSNLINELKAQANTPQWQVLDCLESSTINDMKQLSIFAYNKLLNLEGVNYYALRTAIIAEYFAPDYDRYFITFQSKFSKFTGWGAYLGNVLKKGRIKNSLDAYKGVLDGDLLFFIPKLNLPRFIIKFVTIRLLFKENRKLWQCKKLHKFTIRETNIHRKPKLYLCINDARVYLNSQNIEDIKPIIYSTYQEIVKSVIKSSKKDFGRFSLNKFLPVKYIRICIYDSDMRLRQYHKKGLGHSLICTLSINTTKRIKNIDIIGGMPEQIEKYRIVWNRNWLSSSKSGTE
ncbi:hypothetical protein [uncultured Bacteroides sp.]|uniref:hypothetical protein n=1 Tax=uncultured Bacteroides sp. TaxID=162156 RepID=UPI002AAC3CD4|nr:hypothetical protein [uncultured Bacteroides sp.]